MADWKKEAEEIQKAMQEHERKMETDPEYRRKAEETDRLFSKHLLGYATEEE